MDYRMQINNGLYLLKHVLQECQEVLFSSVLPQGLLYGLKDALEFMYKSMIKSLHICTLKFCCAMQTNKNWKIEQNLDECFFGEVHHH